MRNTKNLQIISILEGGKGQFSIKNFVNHLSSKIPFEYSLSDNVRRTILKYDRIDVDSDGIFPIGIKNWEVVHAKNPMLPKDKYHRTNKNLSKQDSYIQQYI